jgi:hypothetical protein
MPDDQPRFTRDEIREIDRMALDGTKTEWQERSAPAASTP